MKRLLLLSIFFIIFLSACDPKTFSIDTQQKRKYSEQQKEPLEIVEVLNQEEEELHRENEAVVVEDPDSISIVVNKQRKLPDNYEPDDLAEANVSYYAPEGHSKRLLREEAAKALEHLFTAAKEDGLELVAVSGYRSYDRQKQIYERNVATKGQEHADKFSAKPGTSEHQTGLAMDVASAKLVAVLEQSFIETDEGKWLEEYAHEHGFVIRYPEGKEDITGYQYEPWHLRYVGKELATEIYQAQLTLEEYFGLM